MQLVLTPELVIEAYKLGLFPMAESAGSPYVRWLCPERRGQLSIEHLHIPRRLRKTVQSGLYEIRINTAFEQVIVGCAEKTQKRPDSWINQPISKIFTVLHEQGRAHCVECWRGGELVGGVYGLAIGGAFFGESMFSRTRDASKVALVHLCARLFKGGFTVLDTQFVNDHLKQFGVYEVPHDDYMRMLEPALAAQADFTLPGISEEQIIAAYLQAR